MKRVSTFALILLLSLFDSVMGQNTTTEIQKAVEEFKIQTSSLGLRSDSPRSTLRQNGGTMDWHGRVFWNFRNDFLDAVPHEVTQTGGVQGLLRRNQYGFTFSGPVIFPKLFHGGNRTFFSVSYEGMREKTGRSSLRTIPTTPERIGDFSAVVDDAGLLLPIYNPATTSLNPNYNPAEDVSLDNLQYLRDPFPGNRIPDFRLDTTALDAVGYLPQPNISIGPFFQNNYTTFLPEVNKADGMRARLEHTLRSRHRLSLNLDYSNGFNAPSKLFPTAANPGRAEQIHRSRSASLDHIFSISPNSIITFRFDVDSSISKNASEYLQGQPFPVYSFPPYLSMGRANPISKTAEVDYQLSGSFTTRRSSHSLSFSGGWELSHVNSFVPRYPSDYFKFSSGLTSLPGITNTGHAFASFMLGMPYYAESSLVLNPSYFRTGRGEFAFRDEWEVTHGLSLSFGLTLTLLTPRVEKYNRQSTVDLEAINPENRLPGALVFAGSNGEGRAFQPIRVLPQPHFSLAWSPFGGSDTIVRLSLQRRNSRRSLLSGGVLSGGFGYSNFGQWATQGFNGTPTYITSNVQLEPAVILEQGLPQSQYPLPDLRSEAANDTNAHLVDQSGRYPTYHAAELSIERQLPGSVVLTLGATLTRGRSILVSDYGANPNAIPLDALKYRDQLYDEDFLRSLRPYPQYQRFSLQGSYPAGHYSRDEGYIRIEKRTSQGLSLQVAYEFSKQIDDYATRSGLQDYYNRRNERSLSMMNEPHRLSFSYMYELPFGPNRTWLKATDWRKHLTEGWMISGVTNYDSGRPLQLTAKFNNTGNVIDNLYVNSVQGEDPHVNESSPNLWFNPAAFINPPDFSVGNVSRTHPTLREPGSQNHSLSVTKRIRVASDRAIEFIGTAFNFINHANWNEPDTVIGSLESPNLNAGKITGSRGGRVIQLGLRFTF